MDYSFKYFNGRQDTAKARKCCVARLAFGFGRYNQGYNQGGSDGSGRHSAAPMLTAIMSGGVGISGRELSWSC